MNQSLKELQKKKYTSPAKCPHWGVQCFDPFDFGILIHDVKKCKQDIAEGKRTEYADKHSS